MMAGSFRGGMLFLAVFLVFLIGEIRAQCDIGDKFGDLTDFDIGDKFGDLTAFGLGSTPMDLVFVVDTSQFPNTTESLDNEIMVKSFLTSFLESADVDFGDIKIAMLTFSTHPEVVFDLNKYSKSEDIVDAIFTADFIPGERNTADALGRVRSQLLVRDRPDAPNFVLLLTSGKSNRNEYRTLQEAKALKYARANMFVVGYGLDKEDEEEINEIASKPTQENTFLMDSLNELDVVKDVVHRHIFTRAEQASNSPAAGSEMLDVAFLIHFSNTMKRDDFQRVIEFMKDTIQYAGIDDDKVRVGAALFRKRGILIFDFNSYYSKDEVKAGIDKINFNYRAKAASITAGLETVKTCLLVDSAGVRHNVPNLVILITDSNADTEISRTIQAAEKLKADGTAIFAVGINVTYSEELHGLTSSPEYAIMVNDTKHLKGLEYKIQEAFVGLRTDGFPLVIPALQTTTTTTSTTPPTTTTATTTVKKLGSIPMDLVFVVDTSQFSNTTESLDNEIMVKSFLTSFLESADVDSGDIKIAMLTFSTHPEVVFDLNKYSKSTYIVDAILTADFIPGERNTADALGRVRSQLLVRDRPDAPNVVLLLTSGKSNRNENRTLQEAEALKYARANMVVVGYGLHKEEKEEVNEIASKPTQENTFLMDSVDELDVVKDVVYRQIFTRAKQASSSTAAGSDMLDVAFLIHFSNTMKRDDFQRVIEFMKDTIQYAGIDDDKVRVGAALFRKRGLLIFNFNSYYSKDEVKAGIDNINFNFRSKSASITSGLETVISSLLVDSAGVRRNVPNLVILITDTNADTEVSGTIQAAEKLKADGTALFAVGINVTYPDDLHSLTSSPEHAIMVNDTKYLKGKEFRIQECFVGLRTDGLPLVIPALQTTATTTTSTTSSTKTTSTTAVTTLDGKMDRVMTLYSSLGQAIFELQEELKRMHRGEIERKREEERRQQEEKRRMELIQKREIRSPRQLVNNDDDVINDGEDLRSEDEPEFYLNLGPSKRTWAKIEYCPTCKGTGPHTKTQTTTTVVPTKQPGFAVSSLTSLLSRTAGTDEN